MKLCDPKCAVLQLKIEGVAPKIWRQVIVPRDWHLGDLHMVIQTAFEWSGTHAHEFILAGVSFSSSPAQAGGDTAVARVFDEKAVRLRDMIGRDVEFWYETGTNWLIAIVLEDLLWRGHGPDGARCIGGARAAPPEGLEGPEAYIELLSAALDHGHLGPNLGCQHLSAHLLWPYYSEAFDCTAVDRQLAKIVPSDDWEDTNQHTVWIV